MNWIRFLPDCIWIQSKPNLYVCLWVIFRLMGLITRFIASNNHVDSFQWNNNNVDDFYILYLPKQWIGKAHCHRLLSVYFIYLIIHLNSQMWQLEVRPLKIRQKEFCIRSHLPKWKSKHKMWSPYLVTSMVSLVLSFVINSNCWVRCTNMAIRWSMP